MKHQKNIHASVPEVGTITLNLNARISSLNTNVEFIKTTDLIVEVEKPISLERWWKIKYLLQAFLSFATGHAVHPLHMHETRAIKVESPNGNVRDDYLRIELFFRLPELPEDSDTEGSRNMLFMFADIADSWEVCIQNWFQKSELLEPVYELYFGTLHQHDMYPIHEYSSLAQALETYHRRTSNRSELPKDDFKVRRKEILDAVSPEYKDWLQGKLNFANEISLAERLREILSTYTEIFGPFSGQEDFIKKIKDTRNYLTHYDLKSKHKAASGTELYHLSQCLKFLIEMCLFRELGLDDQSHSRNFIKKTKKPKSI